MTQNVHFGTMVRDRLGSFPHEYFLPDLSIRTLSFSETTWERLMFAQGALGELSGATRALKPTQLAYRVQMLQEALASSRIEGTQASLVDVLEADIGTEPVTNPDVEEVLNYQAALEFALRLLDELPISRRLICRTHEVLLTGVRGITKTPGKFRKTPVWIGSPDSTPDRASFIPPLPMHLDDLFAEWERLVNERTELPLVAFLAWTHFQFETIHPFLDGNGRIGRILIELILIKSGFLGGPYLGISVFIERNRSEYYNVLQRVRTNGDVDALLRYFAQAVETQALENVEKQLRLIELRDQLMQQHGGEHKSMPAVIQLLVELPLVSVTEVRDRLGVSQPTASSLLRKAEALGMLVSRGKSGRGRRETWLAPAVWEIFSPYESA